MDDPERASDFVNSIGVNTHIEDSGPDYSSWTNWSNVEAELAYTGITNVRDGVPYAGYTLPEYQRLADQGIKFDLLISNGSVNIHSDLQNIDALEQSNPGAVASVEGSNEFNTNHDVLGNSSSFDNPAFGSSLDASLSAAVKADPLLRTKTVVAASFANAGAQDIAAQGNLNGVVGASNWHAYFGPGDQPGANIASAVANATATATQEPVYITETGYGTAINAANAGGVTPDAQAKLTLKLLLDAQKDGASKTFLYELMDDNGDASNPAAFGNYGLFNGDGTPKPAATAIHNLTTILSDPASDAASFTPSSLDYKITGQTAADKDLLLEKSNGVYDLVVWNEQPAAGTSTQTDVGSTSHTVTVATSSAATIKVYDPVTSTAPVQASSNANSVSAAIGDDPVIFELMPVSTSGGLSIQGGARDVVSGANAGAGAITFSGSGGTLEIDGTSMPGNTIVGFTAGDTINLSGVAYDPQGKATLLSGNVLDVSENGRDYQLQFDPGQNFAGEQFALSDPVGTDITLEPAPVCFVTGTRIRVMRGVEVDVAVEHLVVGDLAVTASGCCRPIRWIAHRELDCARRRAPHVVWPVRVLAGAFGGGLPERDLRLSPGHLVLVTPAAADTGGVLVPIMCLINGTSIARVPSDTITYWHVELDEHDLLLAEGLPAESYLDWGDRGFFTEGAHACPDSDVVPGTRCRPVAVDGRLVEAERHRLDALFEMRLITMAAWSPEETMALGL